MQVNTDKSMESNLDVGLCSRIVVELMDGLAGHEVYTDNYYTSPLVYIKTRTMLVEEHRPTGLGFLNQLLGKT